MRLIAMLDNAPQIPFSRHCSLMNALKPLQKVDSVQNTQLLLTPSTGGRAKEPTGSGRGDPGCAERVASNQVHQHCGPRIRQPGAARRVAGCAHRRHAAPRHCLLGAAAEGAQTSGCRAEDSGSLCIRVSSILHAVSSHSRCFAPRLGISGHQNGYPYART